MDVDVEVAEQLDVAILFGMYLEIHLDLEHEIIQRIMKPGAREIWQNRYGNSWINESQN